MRDFGAGHAFADVGRAMAGFRLDDTEADRGLLRWAAAILWLDALTVVPMAHLRFRHQALQYSLLRLFNVAVNIGGNLLFVLYWRKGLEGIFWANAMASGFSLLPLLPLLWRQVRGQGLFQWETSRLRALLALGLPLVPAGALRHSQ